MMFNKNKWKIHCQNVTVWETVHKKLLLPRVDSSSFFLGPVLSFSLIKNLDSRLHMIPSQDGLQRLWRMKMIFKHWGNGLNQRGCNAVWNSRQCAWALGLQGSGMGDKLVFLQWRSWRPEQTQNEHEWGRSGCYQTPNFIVGCINNVGICKKHEIVLLLSHLIWSTGSSLRHCISRKVWISWRESKETSMSDWGSGKHDLWAKTQGSEVV